MADYTPSEHARLLLAEATVLLQEPTEDRSESLYEAVALALTQSDGADVIARLACSAAEGWAMFGAAAGMTPVETLQVVLGNWATAEEALATVTRAG